MSVSLLKVLSLTLIISTTASVKYTVTKYSNVVDIGGKTSKCNYVILHTTTAVKLKKASKKDKITTIGCKGQAKGSASVQFEVGTYKFSLDFSPAKKSKITAASVQVGPPSCPCGRSLVCPVSCSGSCPSTTTKICPLIASPATTTSPVETRTSPSDDFSHCTCDLNMNVRMMIGLTNHKDSGLLESLDNGEATPMDDDTFCACVDSKLNIPN